MPFANNVAFCCLALDEAHLHPGGSVRVDDELQVSAAPPVDLDETWVRWLGTIKARAFRGSGLVLTAQRPIPRFEVVVPYELEQRVRLLHLCLLLQGCAFAPGGLMVGGNTRTVTCTWAL